MPLPNNIPELAIPEDGATDAQEQARCLENAAELVQQFSRKCGSSALDELLAATTAKPGDAVQRAHEWAESLTAQTETLHAEVERFLSLARSR